MQRRTMFRLLLLPILNILFTLKLSPYLFASSSKTEQFLISKPLAYILTFLYISLILSLFINKGQLYINLFKKLDDKLKAIKISLNFRLTVIISFITTLTLIFVFWSKINGFNAVWIKVNLESSSIPKNLIIKDSKAELNKLVFQPYSKTYISLVKADPNADSSSTPKILDILLDKKSLFSEIKIISGCTKDEFGVLLLTKNCLLMAPVTANRVDLKVENPNSHFQVFWLDQAASVLPTAAVQELKLFTRAKYQGWTALKASSYSGFSLKNNEAEPITVKEIVIFEKNKPKEVLRLNKKLLPKGSYEVKEEINSVSYLKVFNVFMALFLVVVGVIELVKFFISRRRGRDSKFFEPEPEHVKLVSVSELLGTKTHWIILAICVTFQLCYSLTTGASYTPDSTLYYIVAHKLIAGDYIDQIYKTIGEKGLGYSAFLAPIIYLFGDGIFIPTLAQHLLLASLSIITYITVGRYFSPALRAALSLLVGLSLIVSPTASLIWTETLFIFFTFSACLVYAANSANFYNLLISGALAGLSMLVRPNGVIVVMAIIGSSLVSVVLPLVKEQKILHTSKVAVFLLGVSATASFWFLNSVLVNHGSPFAAYFKKYNEWQSFLYDERLTQDLFSSIPDKWIYTTKEAHNFDYEVFLQRFPTVLTDLRYSRVERDLSSGKKLPSMFEQASYDAIASDPKIYTAYLDTFLYHTTFKYKGASVKHYTDELNMHIGWLNTPRNNYQANIASYNDRYFDEINGEEMYQLFELMKTSYKPHHSLIRELCLNLSLFAINLWGVLFWGALLGFLIAVCSAPWLLPFLFFSMITVIGYSTNIMPMQRYVCVIEPHLYVGVVILVERLRAYLCLKP